MIRARYIPRVEWERLAQEFLDLRQDGETVMEIIRMFTKRSMFCPKFASEQAQMICYLSMLKTNICQFVATQRCDTLLELQEAARRHELEIELQLREQGLAFQLTAEEARAAPDMVFGMFISLILLIIYVLCLYGCTCE